MEWDAMYYRMCLLLFSYIQLKTLLYKEKMFDTFISYFKYILILNLMPKNISNKLRQGQQKTVEGIWV